MRVLVAWLAFVAGCATLKQTGTAALQCLPPALAIMAGRTAQCVPEGGDWAVCSTASALYELTPYLACVWQEHAAGRHVPNCPFDPPAPTSKPMQPAPGGVPTKAAQR